MTYLQGLINRIKQISFRLRLLATSDPFKVANLWRKKGVPVGSNTCIYRDVKISGEGSERISIGNNCVLTGCILIGHDASTNKNLGITYGEPSPMLPIVIEDGCFIGYGAIVLMGVTIGAGSIVGAGSVVTSDVPPNCVVAGNPAKAICSVEELVEKRRNQFRIT
jgi:acetyltransferase-like isoleucine patch superfamily enzyme